MINFLTNSLNKRYLINIWSLKFFSQNVNENSARMAKSLPKKIPIPGIKHVILISSGKGGVGKSSVTVNLAFALQRLNKSNKIGILDADVFGPSIPRMLNLEGKPLLNKQNLMIPLINYGIKCMSMGFLIDKNNALIWRGLMVMQAINQLLRKVSWGSMDYLLIDMPPGTGDVQLSIIQNIPVSGSIIVTTPQKVATQDAEKSIIMYNNVKCRVLGIVQNMHGFECPSCKKMSYIYGENQIIKFAEKYKVPLLGSIPISIKIQETCDSGKPLHLDNENISTTNYFDEIAKNLIQNLPLPLESA